MITLNYYDTVKTHPELFPQLTCKQLLFAGYKCPAVDCFIGKWSHHNYILYVLTGKLAYHTPGKSWVLKSGDAMFVKKGAVIMQKFFEEDLCIMSFFIPDSYMCAFLRENQSILGKPGLKDLKSDLVIPLGVTEIMKGCIDSLVPYFNAETIPSEALLELKFRELLFNVISNPVNKDLNGYLQTLSLPKADHLHEVMETNCLFNLSLENYAKLCNRSLSSFKRDFTAVYKTNPGTWLLSKKLDRAHHLLLTTDKAVNDISTESGFENSTHFSKAFKKRFGLSPLQYRHQAVMTQPS